MDIRRELHQCECIPPVEWEILDALVFDHLADRRILGIDQRGFGRHLHGFADRAHLQLNVDFGFWSTCRRIPLRISFLNPPCSTTIS